MLRNRSDEFGRIDWLFVVSELASADFVVNVVAPEILLLELPSREGQETVSSSAGPSIWLKLCLRKEAIFAMSY